MKKKTQREQVIELLKTGWYSGFAMNAVDMTVQDLYAKLGLENFQKLK